MMKTRAIIGFVIAFTLAVLAMPAGAQSELKLPPYKKAKLKNGMTLLLMEHHEVPIISFNVVLRAGSVADPAGKEGLASLTAGLLRRGTKARSADQIAAELDFIGAALGGGASADSTDLFAEFLKKDLAKGLELMDDVLRNPTFPQDEVTKMIKQRVDGIKSSKDVPQAIIGNYFNAYLFGKHPYARPSGGDENSLAAITREDVVKFYETHYVPGNAILAVAGDFATAEMEKLLTDRFAAWPARPVPASALPEPAAVQGKRLLLVDKPDATQTFFRIGNVGISRTNPDRVWIEVVNTLFGGRFTSMLSTELRIKNGLTYGAGSAFNERKARGPFFINTFTPNDTTEKCMDMALDVLKRLHEKGITEEDLKSAKTYIKGQFPTDIETTDQLAARIADLEFYGLDERDVNTYYAKIDAMTLADSQRIIKQYFPLENLVFVLVGKASQIETVAKKYASVMDRKSVSQPGF
jgi:predicted Zn-dependent peptidase